MPLTRVELRYYYQYKDARLSACPLTVHALLHLPFYLRHTGPLWTSWAFVMERFCGYLLPAVQSRIRPYRCLDNHIQRRAQLSIVSLKHDIQIRRRGPHVCLTNAGVEISRAETVYDECKYTVMLCGLRAVI